MLPMPLLTVDRLSIAFHETNAQHVVEDVSFTIEPGEVMALIGESGSGKSLTALSVMRLLPQAATLSTESQIHFEDSALTTMTERELQSIRGSKIAMIFQEPMTSLNPLHRIGRQIGEVLKLHSTLSGREIEGRVLELLDDVQLGGLKTRLNAYPHELSGGQRQRVMIAMALACNPALLIADEPTTALDVTVQAEILKLLKKLQEERQMAMLFITHDLHMVQKIAHKVCVMTKGRIVEQGTVQEIFTQPQHDYTKRLLSAQPTNLAPLANPDAPEMLRLEDISVAFMQKRRFFGKAPTIRVLDNVSFAVKEGQTLGVMGESGSGKSTLAMAILRLIPYTGTTVFMGMQLNMLQKEAMRAMRKELQIVFQDPFASLNPRMSVGEIISEGLRAHGMAPLNAIDEVLKEVGLDPGIQHRYPHEFSGGQRQRIAIARALVLKPTLLILDEPTSALDISVQAQIIDLLHGLQQKYTLTMIFISHDLRVIRAMSHAIVVLKDGRIVEQGHTNAILESPQTSYTQLLIRNSL